MRLNPWIWVPAVLGGVVGGVLGWVVARAGCLPESCLSRQVTFALGGGMLALIGMGVLSVLAVMSLAEWRRLQEPPSERDDAPDRS